MRDYPNRREEIAGYVEIMAQCYCSDLREIRINRQDFPQACVQSRFEKLERRHMEYVLKCMAHIPPNIRNIRAYALSTLYNSYTILQRAPFRGNGVRRRGSATRTGITRTNDSLKGYVKMECLTG